MAAKPDPASVPPVAKPGDPLDLSESVAGEEDPGASIDLSEVPAQPKRTDEQKPATDPAGRPDVTRGR